jgi:hypothetical protein
MKKILFITVVLTFIISLNTFAQNIEKDKKLKLYSDVRFRVEADRNSDKKIKDEKRTDRDRLRYRARFGLKYDMTDNIEFGMRARTGAANNPQSPHVTIGRYMESGQFSIDKAYIKLKINYFWAIAGKNSMPFWGQNEMLWDGDVNPEGVSFGGKLKLSDNTKLGSVFGYYILANNVLVDTENKNPSQTFFNHNNMMIAQLKLCNIIKDNKLTVSSGLIAANNKGNFKDDFDNFEYAIWATSLQYKLNNFGLTLGVDYFNNIVDYKDYISVANNHKDQKTGYVGSIKYGKGKFVTAFTYASIQKYAVIDMFAQDDWARWDTTDDNGHSYATLSNFKGFELNFKYKFTSKYNTTLRFWDVRGLVFETDGNQLQSGTRIRLDFNMKF